MSDPNPTSLFPKSPPFHQTISPSGQTTPNLFNTQPSESQSNPLTTSNIKNENPKIGNFNEQQKKRKQLRTDQTSIQNKKQEGGGILRKGKQNQQQTENLTIDTTLHFGLQDIIESIVKGQMIQKRQIGKIASNFKLYVRDSSKPFIIDNICQETKVNQEVKEKMLRLPYLNQIEEKSKKAINLFWLSMIEGISKKIPFLSENSCLDIIKLEISMNKHNYCQKQNLGTFDVKLFTDPHLFPIINSKVQINTQHKTYLAIQNRIIHLVQNQFKSLKVIFKQMSYLKFNQNDKYLKVFQIFQENTELKKNCMQNLFQSFFQMLKFTPQTQLTFNISYFECVAESIWDFYLANPNAFTESECAKFLNKLNQNYTFFNQSGRIVSFKLNNLLSVIEKISINFLLYFPFNYNNWQKSKLKAIILESHLQMFQPFKMLLPQNKREGFKINISQFETSGLHWKQFIQIMIKIQQDDNERVDYILQSMRVFFRQNYQDFWANPQKYQNFYRFTSKVLSGKSEYFEERESIEKFLSILGIGSELMGLKKQREGFMANIGEFGVGYPQRKIRPYGLEVHNQFHRHFMRMSQTEFMEIIGGDVEKILLEMRENQGDVNYDGSSQLREKILLKEYLLNLICCEPCLFYQLCKSAPHSTRQELLKFLIMDTITDSYLPVDIIDTAFGALDRLLTEPNTLKIAEQALALDKSQFNKQFLVDGLFQNIKALPFVARHCSLLIHIDYGEQQWTKALLNKFYQLSIQQGRNLYHMNSYFASSYYQLISGVLSQISMKDNSQISFIKPYINLSFIINSLQYYLKFDLHRGEYVNIAVCEQNPSKIQSFMQCLRLYNIILNNQLKIVNINSEDSTKIGSSFSRKQFDLLTPYEAKKFGIQDDEYYLQVKSLRNLTTSYINALSFILLASSDEQKMVVKQIHYGYEDLIFQTIESLTKLNGKTKLKDHFYVKSTYQTQIPTNLNQWKPDDDLCLKKFISYVQSTLNISGIQTILFADLIQNPQKLRSLIDSLRTKMENPRVSERTSSKLILKAISTLSRYFRDSMARMSLKKDREVNFDRLEIRDHIEFLLETIVKFVVSSKSNRKSWELEMVNKILSNVYGGMLIVQRIKGSQFLRFLKNYHPLLLNSINLSYLENAYSVDKVDSAHSAHFALTEEYFKLLEMFLNCEQYLSERQFKIISGIKGLPQKVQKFMISIANYTQFSKLPEYFVDILLQIMISCVGFFIRICGEEQHRRECLSRCYDIVKQIKSQVKASANLILLQVLIQNQLSQSYSYPQLLMEKQQLLALQMNSVGTGLPIRLLQDIVKKLGKSNLTNLAFLSIATGIFANIQKSQDTSPLLKHILHAYTLLLNSTIYTTQNLSSSLSYHTLRNQQNTPSNLNTNSPYKKIWILQLILAILTNIQTSPTSQKTINLKRFQTLIIQNDGLLKRFGYLMKKNAFEQSETYLPWLNFLQEQINIQLTNKRQMSFVEKLELYQIIKIFSFNFANTNWKQVGIEKNVDLIWVLVQYREVFEKQLYSGKRQRIQNPQEKVLEGIKINSFLSGREMLTSGFKQYERQKITGDILKSQNCFQLLHEALNFHLSLEYALMCASIGIPFCQGLSRKVPQMADISKWNTLFLEFSQVFTQKYIQILANNPMLEQILNGFEKIYSGNSQYNISLSKQMLFTNSPSLSCSLEVSYDSWKQALVETLKLLFEHILMINKKLQVELHSDFKAHQQWFSKIVASLKKHDKQNFNYALYDRSEHKSKMSQTIKSNVTIMHSQANPVYSGTSRNY